MAPNSAIIVKDLKQQYKIMPYNYTRNAADEERISSNYALLM